MLIIPKSTPISVCYKYLFSFNTYLCTVLKKVLFLKNNSQYKASLLTVINLFTVSLIVLSFSNNPQKLINTSNSIIENYTLELSSSFFEEELKIDLEDNIAFYKLINDCYTNNIEGEKVNNIKNTRHYPSEIFIPPPEF